MLDYTQNKDYDLDISSGDLTLGEPTERHKADILLASQGDYKESPTVGVGLMEYLNGEDDGTMLRTISRQMQLDGVAVKRVGFDVDGELIVDGEYGKNNR